MSTQHKTIARLTRTLTEAFDEIYQIQAQLVCYHFPDSLNKAAIWSSTNWTKPLALAAETIYEAARSHGETYSDPQRFMLCIFTENHRAEPFRTCSFVVVVEPSI